jgi:hypothetical protein
MISTYFTRRAFFAVEILPQTERFNSPFFTETILAHSVQSVNAFRPKMQSQGHYMYIDNAQFHNSPCHFRKLKSWHSSDWPSHLIPMPWHPMTSSDSVT